MTANSNNFLYSLNLQQLFRSARNLKVGKTKHKQKTHKTKQLCSCKSKVHTLWDREAKNVLKALHFHSLGELLLLGHSCLKGQSAYSGTVKDRQNRQEETYGEGSSLMVLLLSENRDCSSAQMFTLCDTEK